MLEEMGATTVLLAPEDIRSAMEQGDIDGDEEATRDPFYASVLKSQRDFRESYRTWESWADYKLYPD